MKKVHIILLILIFVFVIIFAFFVIEKNKKPPLAPEKGFENIHNGENYGLPVRTSVRTGLEDLQNMHIPKGYQIVRNKHGVFLLAYIEDTFRYSYIANDKKTKDKTHIQLVFEYLSMDSQIDNKWNHREVLGMYKLKEEPTQPIVVEYYEFETKTWKQLEEVDFLEQWNTVMRELK